MRQVETIELCHNMDFLNWISVAWRSPDSLLKLLSPMYTLQELRPLSYFKRVQKIYGSDVLSQFKAVESLQDAIAQWDKLQKRREVRLAAPSSAIEDMCVNYIKERFELGKSFVVPGALATMAKLSSIVDTISTLSTWDVVESFFEPRVKQDFLRQGDVFFTVIDAHPERKRLHRGIALGRTTDHVIVRAHTPALAETGAVHHNYEIQTWSLRRWCASKEHWPRVAHHHEPQNHGKQDLEARRVVPIHRGTRRHTGLAQCSSIHRSGCSGGVHLSVASRTNSKVCLAICSVAPP
jgi:hypothetical protein